MKIFDNISEISAKIKKPSKCQFRTILEVKGATKSQRKIIFVSATKIADSTTNVFKLLFFRLNPHFNSSDLIDTFSFLPFTKVPLTRFYSVRIKTTHKPSKEVAAKNFFSSVYVIGATCFDEFFLSHVIIEKRSFS